MNFRYLLFLDLDGNGTMETTINSEDPKWGFGIREDEKVTVGGVKYLIGRVTRDFESDDPDHTKYSAFALPYGTHKIKWTLQDRCGNDFTKEFTVIVKDCKNPTVVCINGLAVNQMNIPAGAGMAPQVTLWATDFLQYAEDNCTDAADIDLALRDADINPGTGFPLDANGNPQASLSWDCSQVGTNVVELWARDKWGNADFCLTYLILSDNVGICNGMVPVAGDIKTKPQFDDPTANPGGVTAVTVGIKDVNPNPAFPGINYFPTQDDGHFNFAGVPTTGQYEISPVKDVNPLNGVSTFDLVRMSKHVLNVQPFTTGYQYLAADINNNGQVTTFDIVELRKLILGIYTDFPQNDSWRFIDKNYVFNMSNPLGGAMPEKKMADLTGSNDFVGIKTGDITGDAVANNLTTTDDRTFGSLLFNADDRQVKAGETFDVTFRASEKVAGSQFTMVFSDLELLKVTAIDGANDDNFAVFPTEKLMTASFDNSEKASAFTIRLTATADGLLSKMISVSSRITRAEGYKLVDGSKLDVSLAFRNGVGTQVNSVGFELYQNEPNPFVEQTTVRFHLPEASDATLRIFDQSGKLLMEQSGSYAKGYHAISLDRSKLPASASVLSYQLTAGKFSATKGMVIVR